MDVDWQASREDTVTDGYWAPWVGNVDEWRAEVALGSRFLGVSFGHVVFLLGREELAWHICYAISVPNGFFGVQLLLSLQVTGQSKAEGL